MTAEIASASAYFRKISLIRPTLVLHPRELRHQACSAAGPEGISRVRGTSLQT